MGELRPQERKDKGIHVKKTYLQPNTGVLLMHVHTSVIGQNIPPCCSWKVQSQPVAGLTY